MTADRSPDATADAAAVAGSGHLTDADRSLGPLPHGTATCEDYYCHCPFHEHDVYGWPACANDEWADA